MYMGLETDDQGLGGLGRDRSQWLMMQPQLNPFLGLLSVCVPHLFFLAWHHITIKLLVSSLQPGLFSARKTLTCSVY